MKKSTKRKQKEAKIKSLTSYHAILAVLSLFAMLFIALTNDWSIWITSAVAICLDGKFEKNDELAKQNLGKANTVAMWTLIAALIALYFEGRFGNIHEIPISWYLMIICAALFLRSVLFLIFDRAPKSEEQFE